MDNKNLSSEALLSNNGDMTSFRYGNSNIRFRAPKRLKRYVDVKEWDNGYIVVMADHLQKYSQPIFWFELMNSIR